ncbi:MAG TPA: arginase family protein, partial [Longimicrobiaceae bacterium]|nr:arginase family protein [Longimicrobiaceae bacterium]
MSTPDESPAMIQTSLLAQRLRLSSRVSIESTDADGVVVYHSDRASRLRLSQPLYELLRRFVEPAVPIDVAPEATAEQLQGCLETLVGKGFLVQADAPSLDDRPAADRRLAPAAATLFNCPRGRPGGPRTDVAVLGVPFDLGTPTWAGSRWAPGEVRKRSQDHGYRVDFATARPMGWVDVQHRRRILEGVSIADWGDLAFQYGEPLERIYARTADVVAEMAQAGAFPLVLGGDHSVAYSAVEALQRR